MLNKHKSLYTPYHIMSGYEKSNANVEGSQFFNGEWYAPKYGCDTVQHMLECYNDTYDVFLRKYKLSFRAYVISHCIISMAIGFIISWVIYGK